jgi:hypothetical protein
MRKSDEQLLWVVYRMTIHGKPSEMHAVCEQREWDEMERAQPGYHTLLLQGITNEGEAEKLARSSGISADARAKPKHPTRKPRIWSPLSGSAAAVTSSASVVNPPKAI